MTNYLARLGCLILAISLALPAAAEVLIVADEFPAMNILAGELKSVEHIDSAVLAQKDMPEDLSKFQSVIVYIHGALSPKAEDAFIAYAENGGNLVLLHHSISSGKRKNRHWFKFLGVDLPEGGLENGGYKWIEPATLDIVRLNPDHFIATNKVSYPENLEFSSKNTPAGETSLPAFHLPDSEVYLNHIHTGPHTLLLGLKYTDPKSGITYMQDTAGWLKAAGKGVVIYLMPGHRKEDFQIPAYERIVLNAVIYKP